MFDIKTEEKKVLEELMRMKTHNYWVKIIYHHKKKPTEVKSLEFPQYDAEPYFPRINRFYDWLTVKMPDYKFVDYEVIHYPKEIHKYLVDLDKEYIIH
jgi:uncharacterized protein Usg